MRISDWSSDVCSSDLRDTHAFPATPPAGTPAAVRYNACPRGGAHLPLRERARGADAADVVESHGMRFRAPASVRRSSEKHGTHPQAGRTRGTSRPGNERPLIPSGIAGIAAAFIARMLDLNDEIATCVAPKAGAP